MKAQLADKAIQAAKAAEAALSGKQIIVDQLEEEIKEAQSVVREEAVSLQQTKANVNAAVHAARQSTQQVISIISQNFKAFHGSQVQTKYFRKWINFLNKSK